MSVRVLIADDHQFFVEALQAILAAEPRIDVVGVAASGEDAVRGCRELAPDVVLMDLSMPGVDGFEATRQIVGTRPEARVLVVSGSDAPEDVDAARVAGAAGYVTKDGIADDLIAAVLDAAGARKRPVS